MKNFLSILRNDFKNFRKYNILQIVLMFSILFAAIMAFFTQINPLLLIYVTVFILPVVTFAISMFIEAEERSILPLAMCECHSFEIILSKIVSSLVLLLIPYVLYTLVMVFVLHMNYNIILFLLIYILSAVMHIVIGLVLAIISKSSSVMSVSYVGYIVIFSLMPIFYSQNLIPDFFQYVLVVSPAYLSGVLFEQVIYGYIFSPNWLLITAVLLQIAYITLLLVFIARPYFKTYLLFTIQQEGVKTKK